ncbi:hypothetical protein ACFR9U_13765 [Halorientalis brevis]|uniref:DUF7979 domain-containing protein n=1 Tax=Halorientalis brevis TaxID=1126241 RepID=A0ABD6CEC6_9EURY
MPSIKSLFILVVGAMLVVGGMVTLFFNDRGYQHDVQHLNVTPEGEDVYNYSELSTAGQSAFLHAYRAANNDGTYTVYDKAEKPQEFAYLTDATMEYTVYYQGDYYRLYTSQAGGHEMGGQRVITGLVGVLGGISLLGAGLRAGSDRLIHYSVLSGIIVGSGVAFTGSLWPGHTAIRTPILAGYLLCLLTTIVARGLLELLERPSSSVPE